MRYSLLIFVRNPIEGQVKTRLARRIGPEKATDIYRHLLTHTQQVVAALTLPLPTELRRTVCYADFVNENDLWNGFDKKLQADGDLGTRMQQAFREEFEAGAERVLIIGSDCLDLKVRHVQEAFMELADNEVVFGPATDGGYYLMGMSRFIPGIFENKPWSQPTLLRQTLAELDTQKVQYGLLETLSDVDEWADAKRYRLL
ncbi:TIGR04282 family arsenosugar biosynthesis glycosyltransferase [Tellurirhabdus rosea]|uniref:TIGR04282 family arsenosugar biosynthesis glycosyltransferase n=1 Tax=Tellurirhabdus rosea TaxID=2674997 RepID=UPI002259A4AB|nr:TIGR04282 family arsenosugar biosynthesis glycosyltransferase [Tellurirhabdus rosea]